MVVLEDREARAAREGRAGNNNCLIAAVMAHQVRQALAVAMVLPGQRQRMI
jgi:hypothetical protein